MNKSSEPPPTSFSLLPEDIILHCLARVPRFYRPNLSLVSKYFRSLMASPELEATRSRNGITEDYLYVCLDVNKNNPEPSWFTMIPEQQILKPIPSFPHQHPKSSTVLSTGSEIYIIGGLVNGQRSNRVFSLDCRTHQWRIIPDMRHPREAASADVIDGKIFVIGGSTSNDIEDWGEVYDPKTQTWEPVLAKTLDLTIQKSVAPRNQVMGEKNYAEDGLKIKLENNIFLVENVWRLMSHTHHTLFWNDPKQDLEWRMVQGLEDLSDYPYYSYNHKSVAKSGGKRVTVWWKSVVIHVKDRRGTRETQIWCAEISFERRGLRELWGCVEWSKNVFTFKGCHTGPYFFLHSGIVSH